MNNPNKRVTRIKSDYVRQYDAHMELKQKRKKSLFQRLVVFTTLFVIALGVMISYHVTQRSSYAAKQEESELLAEEIGNLQSEETSLLEEIDLLNDKEYVLDIARTNYFLSKKGELIFQVDQSEERSY